MEKITSKKIASLIEQALKDGNSEEIPADYSNMNYARVLVSKYNAVNRTKLSVKRVHDIHMKISAPDVKISVPGFPGNTLELIRKIFEDPDFKITSDESKHVFDTLGKIYLKLIARISPLSKDTIEPAYEDAVNNFEKTIERIFEEITQSDELKSELSIRGKSIVEEKTEMQPKKNNLLG
jgi:hypothetical protein